MLVMAQVAWPGAPTETVPVVNVLALLAVDEALNRPKVVPATSVATAPAAVIEPAASARRFLPIIFVFPLWESVWVAVDCTAGVAESADVMGLASPPPGGDAED